LTHSNGELYCIDGEWIGSIPTCTKGKPNHNLPLLTIQTYADLALIWSELWLSGHLEKRQNILHRHIVRVHLPTIHEHCWSKQANQIRMR
jgi:hypothetical protein